MVGRPQSLGCAVCRKDKKGCDLRRPACARCVAIGVSCKYTDRVWKFLGWKLECKTPHKGVLTSAISRISSPVSAFCLDRPTQLLQVCDVFWSHFAPGHVNGRQRTIERTVAAPHLLTYRALAVGDENVQNALHALCLVCVGHYAKRPELFREAACFYVKSLRNLNHALKSSSTAKSDPVLATCRVLGLYEMFRPSLGKSSTQGADWAKHVLGICNVIRLRGAEKPSTDAGISLYKDTLIIAASYAMLAKDPQVVPKSLLNTSSQPSVPRADLQDEVMEQLVETSAWLHCHDQILLSIGGTFKLTVAAAINMTLITALFKDGLSLLKRLMAWEERAMSLCRARYALEKDANLRGVCIDLYNVESAAQIYGDALTITFVQHYSTCMLLCAQMWFTHTHLAAAKIELFPLPCWANPAKFATKIVDMAATCLTHTPGFWALANTTLPISSVYHFFAVIDEISSPEVTTLAEVLSRHARIVSTEDFQRSATLGVADEKPSGETSQRAWQAKILVDRPPLQRV